MANNKIYFQENRPQARGILWVHHSQFKGVGSPTILDFIDDSGRIIPIAKENVPVISTNITSDATSNTKTASPKAVKEYVDSTTYTKEEVNTLLDDVSQLDVSQLDVSQLVEITYSELKTLRNTNKLIPGMRYRITDYVTTTAQDNSTSANNAFDVIVVADSANKLNENAKATFHTGDTYFTSAGARLGAWELKYTLDNDDSKYKFATPSGKGVIYWMKDEWNNECPYDFKNIKFNGYYTFSLSNAGTITDFSLNANGKCRDNKIYKWIHSTERKQFLNRNYFINTSGSSNCNSNIMLEDCADNVFQTDCCVNRLGYGCSSNTFGQYCVLNNLGVMCVGNSFDGTSSSNDLYDYCSNNTFGSSVSNNILFDNCTYNIFDFGCSQNCLYPGCQGNQFGMNTQSVILQQSCRYNSIGNAVLGVNVGHGSDHITISGHSRYITIGNYCSYIKFGSSLVGKQYYSNIIVEDENKYIYLNCTGTTSNSNYYKNVKISQAVNTTTTYKTIDDSNVNQNYQTIYCSDSNGNIVSVNLADIASAVNNINN